MYAPTVLLVAAVLLPVLVNLGRPVGAAGALARWDRNTLTAGRGAWDTGLRSRRRSRIILIYGSGGMPAWSADRLRYYVAHVTPEGKADGWFFDTVLFLALAADSQRGFDPGYGNGPSQAEDWRWYLDQRLFGGNPAAAAARPERSRGEQRRSLGEAAELEQAVRIAGKELGEPGQVVRVIIGIPYPDPRAGEFGELDGRKLDFSLPEDRAAAVKWYMRETARRWSASSFDHLRLAGFYWIREEVSEQDRPLLKLVASLAGDQLVPLYWIPYYNSPGRDQWRQLGFDIAIQQPNYYFYDVPQERLRDAAQLAWGGRMGVELELDRRVLQSEERRQRYQSYLEAGVQYGFQQASTLAWYDDTALLECARSQDPAVRRVYDLTCAFVRGPG